MKKFSEWAESKELYSEILDMLKKIGHKLTRSTTNDEVMKRVKNIPIQNIPLVLKDLQTNPDVAELYPDWTNDDMEVFLHALKQKIKYYDWQNTLRKNDQGM